MTESVYTGVFAFEGDWDQNLRDMSSMRPTFMTLVGEGELADLLRGSTVNGLLSEVLHRGSGSGRGWA